MAKKKNTITVELREKGSDLGPITVEEAKDILDWTEEPEKGKGWGTDYTLRDMDGKKVRLKNNNTNRPFRPTLAKRYANEHLRKKWKLNGEPLIIDTKGKVQSAQHRLASVIFAEQLRLQDPDLWKEYGTRGPITMETVVVRGISSAKDVVDTLDLGQKRTLGDVVFRDNVFGKVSDREAKRLSNILAGATRLTWLRSGGQTVSDAPHFPHSEALDFIEDHPRLVDAVRFVFDEDGGPGAEGKKLSTYISLGYAAALLYLMGTSATDPDKFLGEGETDFSLWDKATDFWALFASGSSEDPFPSLQRLLVRTDASGAQGRDEVVGMVVKAFNHWADGVKDIKAGKLKVKKAKTEEGKLVLSECPRLGGLDVERVPEEKEDQEVPEGSDQDHKGSQAEKGSWTVGDTAWVNDEEDGPWFGTITEVVDLELGGQTAVVRPHGEPEGGQAWDTDVELLSVNRPK